MTESVQLERRARAFHTVDRATELPLLILAVAMVPLLAAPFVLDLSPTAEAVVFSLDWLIWAAFGLELIAKTYLAPSRLGYLRSHWVDVAIVVVPFLRPLRIVRSTRALRLLRAVRLAGFVTRSGVTVRVILGRHGLQYVLLGGLAFVLGAATLVVLLERDAGGSIDTFGASVWWALATVTTVGYGDAVPASAAGWVVGAFLMIVGVGIFGVLTANVAAFFVDDDTDDVTHAQLLEELQRLHQRLDDIEAGRS